MNRLYFGDNLEWLRDRGVNPKTFFSELKRRNVYKVAVAYAVHPKMTGTIVVEKS